jgi:hypothetical protein
MKWIDPIVQDVRSAREKLWEEYNFDFDQLYAKLKEKQLSHGLPIVTKTQVKGERKHVRQHLVM